MSSFFDDFVNPGVEAVKRFWKPLLLIEACGLAVVISYFNMPAVKSWMDALAEAKDAGGLPAAIAAAALAGSVVPEIAKTIALGEVRWNRGRVGILLFNLGLWALMGFIAIYFYGFLQWLWPEDGRTITALKKMALDQFVYSPFLTLPIIALLVTLRERKSRPQSERWLGMQWYSKRVAPLIIPCWIYWIPMTTLMYSLPANLVFVFCMFATAAWSLVVLFVATSPSTAPEPQRTAAAVVS